MSSIPNVFNAFSPSSQFANGQLYMFCGENGNALSTIWVYNPSTGNLIMYL